MHLHPGPLACNEGWVAAAVPHRRLRSGRTAADGRS